jgi:sugar/nucleoside kinase (ribokinase family)
VGNALLDVIMRDHDGLIDRLGLAKGAMTLVDQARAAELLSHMTGTIGVSGGSAANTIAGVAALGGAAGFVGKVGADRFGDSFSDDLESLDVDVHLVRAEPDGECTGRCHVFVADDAQRTMATYLGAANQLSPDEFPEAVAARSEIVYIEGYLFDLPPAKDAIRRIVALAHEHDTLVALSLSDTFCVERHRGDFLDLVTQDVDVLLANESEAVALFQSAGLDPALSYIDELGVLGVITTGPSGAAVAMGGGRVARVPAADVDPVVDQNGAGDLFASGFLYGLAIGADPVEAARLGSLCAGEVISHLGARPEVDLGAMAVTAGLL